MRLQAVRASLLRTRHALAQLATRLRVVLLIAIAAATAAPPAPLAAQSRGTSAKEYRVKAAFLFKFAKFVAWPEGADDESFRLCVFGDDPFGSALDEIIAGKSVGGRPVQVLRAGALEELGRCQVLFISDSEKGRLARVLAAVEDVPALTVADFEGFAKGGGMIGLGIRERKVNLVINPDAAKAAGLKIDSELLSLAQLVSADE